MTDYEAMVEQRYRSVLGPGDACIDVGAHVGRHTFPMAECVGRHGHVFAFEPIPALASALIERTKTNEEILVTECALSDEDGVSTFIIVNESPGYSGLRERNYDSPVTTRKIDVQTLTLDGMLHRLPIIRYIKIDCEGAELHVLRGSRALIAKYRPIISFECGDSSLIQYEYSASDIFAFFESLNYEIFSIHGTRLNRTEFIQASASQQFWDYVADPRSETVG